MVLVSGVVGQQDFVSKRVKIMKVNPVRSLLLVSTMFAIGMSFQSTESSAHRKYCDLTVKGSGRHSCQCEVLYHHRAPWKVLMHLSSLNACDSPSIGGGGSNPGPKKRRPPPDDCEGGGEDMRYNECPK